ncbi:MAG: N-acetylmuramoyl-L-alanine amidase [Lachnospiraceae bacterium]|nr:N-acetylmuramoyl-L-alanine amidase [Lachnospiraceae bacterium]
MIGILALICLVISKNVREDEHAEVLGGQDSALIEDFLTPNEYSRPQKPLKKVKGIVVHYTANPGTDAKANRDYFEGLSVSGATYASSHFVIGLDGTIIQCIPLNEIAYASNDRNDDTISIECCHQKKNGKFTEETYNSLVRLTAWLCGEYDVSEKDIIRHYDVTGKLCPKYFVKHEDKWAQFKDDVKNYSGQGQAAAE